MVNQDNAISFLDETDSHSLQKTSGVIKILTVDDDESFQRSTAFALSTQRILDCNIELTQVNSYAEASLVVAERNDFAIALIDVVMETEDAGLRLVRAMRDVLGNDAIRIILLTGQPGMAPIFEVMRDYDINDYWSKSELSSDRLHTILTTNLRSYNQICSIARAKRGLQLIAESSGALYTARSIKELSGKMLQQLSQLLMLPTDGIVCVKSSCDVSEQGIAHKVIGATGAFERYFGLSLQHLEQQEIRAILELSLNSRQSRFESNYTCLFFPDDLAGADYAVYLATGRPLDVTESELIQVFSMNICGGLHSVALMSQLDRIAFEDPLLKMPNRNVLNRALESLFTQASRNNFNLLVIDIDKFSDFNRVFGSTQGNNMLKHVASSLRQHFDPSVLVTRLKDDKFAVLGPKNLVTSDAVTKIFEKPYMQGVSSIAVNLSTVTLPLELADTCAVDALTQVNIALKKAKKLGIRQHLTYEKDSEDNVTYRFELLQALQLGMTRDELHIELQPQICLITGKVTGVEALARWTLPDGTKVPPLDFIPIAETTGLITDLGEQLFNQACVAMAQLHDAGYHDLCMGINLSAIQFEQEGFVARIEAMLNQANVNPQNIEVEVTESIAMQNFEIIRGQLNALRKLKIKVAIDDFGTGFSSLAYLSKLPIDRIKIDKSFIDHVIDDDRAAAIVDSVIILGQSFELNLIAEGVETIEQARWLRDRGCHDAQGYFYAKPMPLTELLVWLKTHKQQRL